MPSIPNPFAIVSKAVRAFFTADVKLQRGRRGLVVVLDDGARAAAKAAAAPESRQQRELRCIQDSLATLLDEQEGNRQALRHLAFVEHALQRAGTRAFDKIPLDVMRRAHAQLDGLVTNWSDEGLAALRSKLAVALSRREPPKSASAKAETAATPAADVAEVDEGAALAHPVPLEGEDAAEAEAALLAAYGSMSLEPAAPAKPPVAEPSL